MGTDIIPKRLRRRLGAAVGLGGRDCAVGAGDGGFGNDFVNVEGLWALVGGGAVGDRGVEVDGGVGVGGGAGIA